jgi:DNA-binding NarL/FixJ family response regulator
MASGTFAAGARWRATGVHPVRVAVTADSSELVEASRATLAREPHVVVAGASPGLGDVGPLARRLMPRVIVVATGSRDPAVVTAIRATREAAPAAAVVVLTARGDEPYVRMVLEAGTRGYVSLDDPDLGRAVRAVASGGAYFSPDVARVVRRGYLRRGGLSIRALLDRLTDAEREVLRGLVHGETTREIGARLHLSTPALAGCRRHIVAALGDLR